MAYHISIAENDRNGTPQGWAEHIEIEQLTLENTGGHSPKISFHGGRLYIGEFACDASRSMWVGNIFWNEYFVAWCDAMDAINYLMGLGNWDCVEAPCLLYDKFHAKERFTHEDMKQVFLASEGVSDV